MQIVYINWETEIVTLFCTVESSTYVDALTVSAEILSDFAVSYKQLRKEQDKV